MRKYILYIDNEWTEYNKMWTAIKYLRNYLKTNLTAEPHRIKLVEVDVSGGYKTIEIPLETILRGVLWSDTDVPEEWTGSLIARFKGYPETAAVNTLIRFSSGSYASHFKIVKYEWSFDNGVTWTEGDKFVEHTFTTTGTYKVLLRITNDAGDIDKSKVLDYVVIGAQGQKVKTRPKARAKAKK